jgi:hypothetical protein
LPGSSSSNRSSSRGFGRARGLGGGIDRHGVQRDHADVEQRHFGLVGREHALADAVEGTARLLTPVGGTRQAQRHVGLALGARIARGDQRDVGGAVLQRQRGGRPHEVAQVGRLLDLDAQQARDRHPVVLAVDDGLEHRPEAAIGIGQPRERCVVELARRGRRNLEGAGAQFGGGVGTAFGVDAQRLDHHREPVVRLAQHQRRALAVEDLATQRFAAQGLAVGLHHRLGGRVEFQQHFQLRAGLDPFTLHAVQLEQEDPQVGALRLLLDHLAQFVEVRQRVGGGKLHRKIDRCHGHSPGG